MARVISAVFFEADVGTNDSKSKEALPAISPAEPVPEEYDFLCEGCGYSLVGLMSDRCPECGKPFDPADLPLARIPWLYRIRLGRFRTYYKTVHMITYQSRAFAEELTRPVRISANDAFAFRRLTIRLFWSLTAGITIVCLFLFVWDHPGIPPQLMPTVTVDCLLIGAAGLFGAWLFLWLATDMPTFIWRGLPGNPKNLAPLHHYACAPLILIPCTTLLVIAIAGFAIGVGFPREWLWAPALISSIPTIRLFWKLWRIPQIFMRQATGCTWKRQLAMGLYLPLHWFIMASLGFMVIAMMAIFIEAWQRF